MGIAEESYKALLLLAAIWHPSFLTTIMAHSLSFSVLLFCICSKIIFIYSKKCHYENNNVWQCIKVIAIIASSCSIDTSTEALAPAVLSWQHIMHLSMCRPTTPPLKRDQANMRDLTIPYMYRSNSPWWERIVCSNPPILFSSPKQLHTVFTTQGHVIFPGQHFKSN